MVLLRRMEDWREVLTGLRGLPEGRLGIDHMTRRWPTRRACLQKAAAGA
jgi:hypothetical protein